MELKHLQSTNIFSIPPSLVVRPVDGEKHFNEPGLSHGFVHFADPKTGKRLGFCGIDYFDKHAKRIKKTGLGKIVNT